MEIVKNKLGWILMVDLAYQALWKWDGCLRECLVPATPNDIERDAAVFCFLSERHVANLPVEAKCTVVNLQPILPDGRFISGEGRLAAGFGLTDPYFINDMPLSFRRPVHDHYLDREGLFFAYAPSKIRHLSSESPDQFAEIEKLAWEAEDEMQVRLEEWGGDEDWNRFRNHRMVRPDYSDYWVSLGFPPAGPPPA